MGVSWAKLENVTHSAELIFIRLPLKFGTSESPPICTPFCCHPVNSDAGLPKRPSYSSKEGHMVTLACHGFRPSRLWFGTSSCGFGKRKLFVTLSVEMLPPKSCINSLGSYPLPAVFPYSLTCKHGFVLALFGFFTFLTDYSPEWLWCRTWQMPRSRETALQHWEEWIFYVVYIFSQTLSSLDERCYDYQILSSFYEQDVIIRLELINGCQILRMVRLLLERCK